MLKEMFDLPRLLKIFTIAVLAFVIYSNVLHGEFISDDFKYIVNRGEIRNIGDIPALWNAYNTRFITGLSFAFNYYLGGLNTIGYHIFNILIHVGVSCLVFILVETLFKSPTLRSKYEPATVNMIGFVAALIFLCHPVAVQSTAYIMQRATSMAAFFYLLTVILYCKGRTTGKSVFIGLAFIVLAIGCFTKETIMTVPLILLLSEICLFNRKAVSVFKERPSLVLFFLLPLIIPLIMSADKVTSTTQFKYLISFAQFDWNYIWTEINVLRTYLYHFFIPVNLTIDYQYPVSQSFFELSTVISIALFLAMIGFGIFRYDRNRIYLFLSGWFFITPLVEMISVVFGNRNIIYDHWSYITMVSYVIALSVVLFELRISEKIKGVIIIVVLGVLCGSTYNYNEVWRSEIALWRHAIKITPSSPNPYFALGHVYGKKGDRQKERALYFRTLEIEPGYVKALNNLGINFGREGNYEEALKYFERALRLEPTNKMFLQNRDHVRFLMMGFTGNAYEPK